MKSILKYVIILIAGIFIGGIAIQFFQPSDAVTEEVSEVQTTPFDQKYKKKKKKKTTQSSELSNESFTEEGDEELQDSITSDSALIQDTLSYSSDEDEYLEIVSERLIKTRNITIKLNKPDSLDAEDLLNLKADSYAQNMVVEFWESPLDLIGYELNRSRLKLFGFNSDDLVTMSRDYDSEQLVVTIGAANNADVIVLEKTPKFKSIILK